MKTKVAIALALLAALSIAACSDNDESKPKPEPTKQKYTLADSYVMPTSLKFFSDSVIYPDGTKYIEIWIEFSGQQITPESDSEAFDRISRLYGDTACTWKAKDRWQKNARIFLGNPLVSIKAIAANDSWGNDYPKGADISEMFLLRPVNATEYIKSGYFKALAELNLERIPYVKMPQWQPANGYAMVNHLIFNQMKPGNKFDLKMTFANGEELVTKDCKL